MIGLGAVMTPADAVRRVEMPAGLGWDHDAHPVTVLRRGGGYGIAEKPRDLVDPAIWSGPAFHVDAATGDDANSGIGTADGDFSDAVRTIHAAFTAGNATSGAYRVLIKPGLFEESAFTANGNVEPSQPVAILGWGGPVIYRAGPASVTWQDAGGTARAGISAVRRVFRGETSDGAREELQQVADLAACAAETGTWFSDGASVHVNVGGVPGSEDLLVIRSFHGARFLTHAHDLYLEDIHCQGGITGALHCDAEAERNIVGVRCSFRYSAPSNPAASLDAARVRRTRGLVAFFDCDASSGAKDGWSFHEDGFGGMHVLLANCTGRDNGADPATSCNGFTTHDGVVSMVLGGAFGWSRNGTEVHCIQSTRTWLLGTRATARDGDGTSVAFKCSNASSMWLEDTVADAVGGTALAIEANGGTVFTRGHRAVAGGVETSNGGSVSRF